MTSSLRSIFLILFFTFVCPQPLFAVVQNSDDLFSYSHALVCAENDEEQEEEEEDDEEPDCD